MLSCSRATRPTALKIMPIWQNIFLVLTGVVFRSEHSTVVVGDVLQSVDHILYLFTPIVEQQLMMGEGLFESIKFGLF